MNPIEAAKAARLRYVSDEMPGIRRERRGGSFTYIAPDGTVIKDEDELARIKSLAVPPAYEDVWICPIPNGHMQATARDARGRKQYRYHKRWREVRDETKFERTIAFAHALPKIRKRLEADLSLPDLPREKVLATIVQLLETTAIRIGNDEYAKENNSYGLTTLRNTHAKVEGSKVRFSFRGKSGVRQAVDLRDRRLARIIRRCQDLPGQQLFEYVDDDGAVHSVDSSDVNEYIRAISGDEFSAKDFRTWVATVTCAVLLASDTVEEWTIEATSVMCGHPFHLHDNSFQVFEINGQPVDPPLICDTIFVPPQYNAKPGVVKMRVRFKGHKGKTVYHCHVLPHEDTGMMQNILVT